MGQHCRSSRDSTPYLSSTSIHILALAFHVHGEPGNHACLHVDVKGDFNLWNTCHLGGTVHNKNLINLRFGWIWGGPWYTLFLNKPISPLGAVCGRGVLGDVWSGTLLKDQANQRLCRIITTFRTARLARLVAKLERPLKTFKLIWRFPEMGVSPGHLF